MCVQIPNDLIMCVFTECTSNSRLVGTFLSVCALTVLCGLVVVAVYRLLLQRKRVWSPGGTAEDRVYHCTGKVSSQKSGNTGGGLQLCRVLIRRWVKPVEPSDARGTL